MKTKCLMGKNRYETVLQQTSYEKTIFGSELRQQLFFFTDFV